MHGEKKLTANNPIQTVKDLNFSAVIQRNDSVFIDIPSNLNISPNGQYLALSNEKNLYLFDLQHPELSWHQGIAMESTLSIVPTDSGGYWISQYDSIQFINKDGIQALKMNRSPDYCMWGNDHWLLILYEKQLKYINTSNFFIQSLTFKHMVLHAWKHGDCLRLLSVSRRKKKMFLYEWDCQGSNPKQITTFSYPHTIHLSKYHFQHVHAWPLHDQAVLIKLMPWAIIVSGNGEISVSDDYVAWHPVMSDKASEMNISKAKLAELTACFFDHGMDTSKGFDPHIKPFLITTLLHKDSIHVITTQWHKRLLIRHMDTLTDKHLDACLEDHDVVSMLLANSERSLVGLQENLPASLMHMFNEGSTEYQFKRVLDQRRCQISRLFELYFPKVLNQQIDQSKEYLPAFLKHMYENLQSISLRPLLAPVFFESFDDQYILSDDDQHWIESSIKTLIPILPEYVRKIIPNRLLEDVPSFCQILTDIDLPTARFLLDNAPDHLFDFETFIFILNHFPSDEDIMLEVLIHRKHLWSQHASLNSETRSRLTQALTNMLHCGDGFNKMLLAIIIAHQIMIPERIEHPHARLIYLLGKHDMSVYEVAKFLAAQTATGDTFDADVIEPEIEIVQSKQLIPSIILTMLELTNARVANDLHDCLEICQSIEERRLNHRDDRRKDMDVVIASLWNQRLGLDESAQWAFAVILLSAIKRCLSDHQIASLISGQSKASRYSAITAEAQLLKATHSEDPQPFQEIFVCLTSEIGMKKSHKDISESLLGNYRDE